MAGQAGLPPETARCAENTLARCLRPIDSAAVTLPQPLRTRRLAVFAHRCADRAKSAIKALMVFRLSPVVWAISDTCISSTKRSMNTVLCLPGSSVHRRPNLAQIFARKHLCLDGLPPAGYPAFHGAHVYGRSLHLFQNRKPSGFRVRSRTRFVVIASKNAAIKAVGRVKAVLHQLSLSDFILPAGALRAWTRFVLSTSSSMSSRSETLASNRALSGSRLCTSFSM